MVEAQQPSQIYPLGQPESGMDRRFTLGVVMAVAEVLAKHGFPDIVTAGSGADALNLEAALFRFIYGDPGGSGRHTFGCAVWTSPLCDCGGESR
jgi:hypothetical protein